MKMQVRLKVQRAHAAAVSCLPYWQEKLEETEAEREAIIARESAGLLKMKSICGGFKYNEQSARKYILEDAHWEYQKSIGLWRNDTDLERRQNTVNWLTRFINNTQDKSGFMVILTEQQYGWIWTDV